MSNLLDKYRKQLESSTKYVGTEKLKTCYCIGSRCTDTACSIQQSLNNKKQS